MERVDKRIPAGCFHIRASPSRLGRHHLTGGYPCYHQHVGNLQKLHCGTMHTSCRMRIDFVTMCTKYVLTNQHLPCFRLIWLPVELKVNSEVGIYVCNDLSTAHTRIHIYLEHVSFMPAIHNVRMMKVAHSNR